MLQKSHSSRSKWILVRDTYTEKNKPSQDWNQRPLHSIHYIYRFTNLVVNCFIQLLFEVFLSHYFWYNQIINDGIDSNAKNLGSHWMRTRFLGTSLINNYGCNIPVPDLKTWIFWRTFSMVYILNPF